MSFEDVRAANSRAIPDRVAQSSGNNVNRNVRTPVKSSYSHGVSPVGLNKNSRVGADSRASVGPLFGDGNAASDLRIMARNENTGLAASQPSPIGIRQGALSQTPVATSNKIANSQSLPKLPYDRNV